MPPPPRFKKAVSAIGPVILALLVLAIFAEAGTRFLNRSGGVYDVEMYRYSRLLKEDAPPEAAAMHHWHRKNAEALLQGVTIRTNDLRMRDRPRRLTPEPGVRRLIVLGDSITLGWGVPQERTYASVLESRIAALSDVRHEVLNAGVGNYTLSRMIGQYDFALRGLQPETVILAFYLTNASREQESSFARFLDTPLHFPVFLWSRGLRATSRLSPSQSFRDYYLALYQDGGEEYEAFKAQLVEFVSRLRAEGKRVVLVNVPDVRYASVKPYPFRALSNRVLFIGGQAGASTLDLTDTVTNLAPEVAVNSAEDRHPSAIAHERFAEAILQVLHAASLVSLRTDP